jgi:hypothetical protein
MTPESTLLPSITILPTSVRNIVYLEILALLDCLLPSLCW